MFVKKIVVLGPESTGKSYLCAQLAAHYQTQWVPEFARKYLLANGKAYTQGDLYTIAMGQLAAEDAAVESILASKTTTDHSIAASAHTSDKPFYPLLIDTDMYVMKVWSEIVFHQCDNRILNAIAQRSYDLYLLCDTDLPWIADELREYPDLAVRQTIFQYYKDAMLNQHVPFTIISGNTEERFTMALEAIEQLR
jgi:NadR type nicotinamide-nucleotide adenylyltransferase